MIFSKKSNKAKEGEATLGNADFGPDPFTDGSASGETFGGMSSFKPNTPASARSVYDPTATTTTSTLPTYKAPDPSKGEKGSYKAPEDTYVPLSQRQDNSLPTYKANKYNTVKHEDHYISPSARNNEEGMSTYVVTKHNKVEHEDNYIPLAERNKLNKLPTYKAGGKDGSSAKVVNPNRLSGGFGNDSDDDFDAFMNAQNSNK